MRSGKLCGAGRTASVVAALAAGCVISSTARATVIYDEGVSGDLSDNQAAPKALSLSAGTNSIVGNVGGGNSQDWVALTVPAGFQLSSVVLGAYNSTDVQGFTGFQIGSSFAGSTGLPGSYAGYSHFGTGATNGTLGATNLVGADLLPIMHDNSPTGTSAGASGFTSPLAAGTYTFLIQQLGGSTDYRFDYNVTAVPEPMSMAVLLLAAPLTLRRKTQRPPTTGR